MAHPRWYLLALVALVLALAACGSPSPRPVENFSLRLSPADPKLAPGGRVTVSIEITRQSGFTGPITLSLEGAPAGVVASFDPNPATEDFSTVTLEAPTSLAIGNYSLQVRGTSGPASSSATASLTVLSVPPSTLTIDPSLSPSLSSRKPLADGVPRPVVALSDARGNQVDFVENELLIFSNDAAAVEALIARWNGTLLRRADPPKGNPHNLKSVFQVRVNTSSADTSRLLSDLSQIDPASRSDLKVSSQSALRLLSVAAREKLAGMELALNVLTRPQTFEDNTSFEGILQDGTIGNSYSLNVFDWPYMRAGGIQNIGVVDAWRALERAGRINPANGSNGSVRIAIIDGGFFPNNNDDFHRFSADSDELNNTNPMPCSGGNSCPYHGTNVAMAAAARADNNFGTAGPAAPVAHLLLYEQAGADDVIYSIFEAIDEDARIINMSFGVRFPAIGAFLGLAFDAITAIANAYGVMLIASAGNDGENVDAEDCFIVCWEEAYWSPCENTYVICVGGLADNSVERHPGSNYGGENVDIFAPFRVFVGVDPGDTRNQLKAGTSFSSPFMAGVAALVWAANPSLTDDQVWSILRNTAHKVTMPGNNNLVVRRYVNAFAAVRQALGNIPPRLVIEAPANNTSLPFRSNFTFRANSSDLDGPTPLVSWSSNVDGALGQGSEITRSFTSPGPRQITASITDSGGITRSASISVTGTNLPPTAEIISPNATPTSVLVGQTVLFRGRGLDADGAFPVELPCNRLTWSSNNNADTLGSGCEFTASFATTGTRRITLRATDPWNAFHSTFVDINVQPLPPSGPPVVTITNPKNGDSFVANSNIRLSYSMTDPGGGPGSQYTVVWRLIYGSQSWTIVPKTCTLNQIPFPCFTPADYGINNNGVKLMQLRLSVTDPESLTGTDQVNISIGLVP